MSSTTVPTKTTSAAQNAPVQVQVRLGENNYGKAEVKLMKVNRGSERHEIRELAVRIAMTGDFGAAHTQGDNTDLVATDDGDASIRSLVPVQPPPRPALPAAPPAPARASA